MRSQIRLGLFGMECHRLPFAMSKLEARANLRVSRFSRDRKNLRLTGEKCTGPAGGPSTLLGGGLVLLAIRLTGLCQFSSQLKAETRAAVECRLAVCLMGKTYQRDNGVRVQRTNGAIPSSTWPTASK
jgi:hypothetical protein